MIKYKMMKNTLSLVQVYWRIFKQLSMVGSLGALYTTLLVKFNTPAQPPSLLILLALALLLFGYVFNRRLLLQDGSR